MNTLSRERDFITLEKEMEYVKFYMYLQQMRFEDKITYHIQIPEHLIQCRIPCFCIQPLVENALTHGLEPKKPHYPGIRNRPAPNGNLHHR